MILEPLLQTVKYNNPDNVKEKGPFQCDKDPWLGKGYYFWDRFESLAHWWGNTHYSGSYMICKASVNIQKDEYLDLVGNTEQIEYFFKECKLLEDTYKEELCVRFVIEYLKSYKLFPYKVIRSHSINCGKGDSRYRLRFSPNFTSYINLIPAIQLCVTDKSCIKNYKIIYSNNLVV